MKRFIGLFFAVILSNSQICGVPIDTPKDEERNELAIKVPGSGWGYRTFHGENGLIAALWPSETSFNNAKTVIFVFIQNSGAKLPLKPDNINLFTEKCPSAKFTFFSPKHGEDVTKSIAEAYFGSSRCGRTMILFKEEIATYTLIVALVSAAYIPYKQFAFTKDVVKAYRNEIEQSIKDHQEIEKISRNKANGEEEEEGIDAKIDSAKVY
jgi:hypothetical protein